jgi:eukaryotic-like serine/threonine-protein kinase
MARPFNETRLEFQGDGIPIAQQPWMDFTIFGSSGFSLSDHGVLAYREGENQRGQFTWFDRTGKKVGTVGPPARGSEPALSPDESRILFYQWEDAVGLDDLWQMELASGKLSRFTFDPADDNTGVWLSDGSRIIWSSLRSGWYELYQKPANGAGSDEPLLVNQTIKFPDDFSPDDKYLLYDNESPGSLDLMILPMTGDRKPYPYLQTAANEGHGHFSPDGKWIVYASDESGRTEIYVQGFPEKNVGKWQISNAGGDQPLWRRDGKELFYLAPDRSLVSVDVRVTGNGLLFGTPKILFKTVLRSGLSTTKGEYMVTKDGQRFLINVPLEDTTKLPITVVLNWTKLLKQ